MTIHHPKVKKILRQCERKIMKLTGKGPISIFILNSHPATIPYEDIEKIVCDVTGVNRNLAIQDCRKTEYRITRQLICFYARTHTSLCFRLIGEKVKNYHHTTVIHSVERIKDLIQTDDPYVCRYVKEINSRIAQLKETSTGITVTK